MAQDWTDTVAEALERLDVADTLEELRHHIDALIHRLAESEAEKVAPSPQPDAAKRDEGLDGQIAKRQVPVLPHRRLPDAQDGYFSHGHCSGRLLKDSNP